MDRTPPAATQTQNMHEDLAVLRALETSGTILVVAKRLEEGGVTIAPERLQAILDAQVSDYFVLCGPGNEYVRLPAGARAVADAVLVQGGRT